jgi:hypothetical protein
LSKKGGGQGAFKKTKLKATYIWQMTTKWGRYVPFFFINFLRFFMAFGYFSQQRELKNTTKNFFGKVHVKNFWPKKLRGGENFFPVVFSLRFFYRVFWPFLCMKSPKTPLKYFLKLDPKISKNLKKYQNEAEHITPTCPEIQGETFLL